MITKTCSCYLCEMSDTPLTFETDHHATRIALPHRAAHRLRQARASSLKLYRARKADRECRKKPAPEKMDSICPKCRTLHQGKTRWEYCPRTETRPGCIHLRHADDSAMYMDW